MLDTLRKLVHKYVNFKKDEEFIIFVAWIVVMAALLSTLAIQS